MKFSLEINNQAKSPVKKAFFDTVGRAVFSNKEAAFLPAKDFALSLALISRSEIKKINRIWRKKNEVTDVLSFAEFKNRKALERGQSKEVFLGEIILCYDDIKAYARENDLKIEAELAKVFLHGILHLLGFRHGREMFSLQNKLLTKLKNKLWKE